MRFTVAKFTLSLALMVKVNLRSKDVVAPSNIAEKSLLKVELSSAGARLSARSKNLVNQKVVTTDSEANTIVIRMLLHQGC